MNRHELLDVAPLWLAGKLLGEDRKLFARRLGNRGYRAHLDAVSADLPWIDGPFERDLQVDSLAGTVDAGVAVARWLGPDRPTVVYHHGTRERPFSSNPLRSSFRRLLLDADPPFEANLVAVRAPFHTLGFRAYLDRLTDGANFLAMLAVPVELTEAVVDQLDGRVVVAGLSMGGFVANLHRTFHDSADAYVPMLSGTLYSDVLLEGAFRHVTAGRAKERPESVRDLLDFDAAFRDAESEVRPLLARHDAAVRYEPQRRAYGDLQVRTLEKGHVTASRATDALCAHVRAVLD